MPLFSGVLTTPMTPFDDLGRVQPDLIEPFVAHQVDQGISGFFCLGTWGGFAILGLDERKIIAESYCAAAKRHGARICIQVTCLSPADTITLAKHAFDHGADAVASVVPMHYSADGYLGMNEYKRFFALLAKSVEGPVHLYNNERTGFIFEFFLY